MLLFFYCTVQMIHWHTDYVSLCKLKHTDVHVYTNAEQAHTVCLIPLFIVSVRNLHLLEPATAAS